MKESVHVGKGLAEERQHVVDVLDEDGEMRQQLRQMRKQLGEVLSQSVVEFGHQLVEVRQQLLEVPAGVGQDLVHPAGQRGHMGVQRRHVREQLRQIRRHLAEMRKQRREVFQQRVRVRLQLLSVIRRQHPNHWQHLGRGFEQQQQALLWLSHQRGDEWKQRRHHALLQQLLQMGFQQSQPSHQPWQVHPEVFPMGHHRRHTFGRHHHCHQLWSLYCHFIAFNRLCFFFFF